MSEFKKSNYLVSSNYKYLFLLFFVNTATVSIIIFCKIALHYAKFLEINCRACFKTILYTHTQEIE